MPISTAAGIAVLVGVLVRHLVGTSARMPTSARTPRRIAGGFGGLREGDGRLEERRVQGAYPDVVPPSLHEEADEETEDEGDDDAHAGEGSEVRGAEDGGEMTLMLEGDAETGEVQERGPRQQQRGLRVKRQLAKTVTQRVVRAGPGEPPDGVEELGRVLEQTAGLYLPKRVHGGGDVRMQQVVPNGRRAERRDPSSRERRRVRGAGRGRPRRRAGRDPPRRGRPREAGVIAREEGRPGRARCGSPWPRLCPRSARRG